jgi:serine/threonine protein kinase/lipopolysaccharide biosynthesis regulator YciM
MTIRCPKCNTINPDDSKFCKECASPLKRPEEVSVTKTIKAPATGISKGTLISGKYKILQKLGEGGMGIVYKAKDSRLDRTVALKFLSFDLTKDKEARKRFIQEAKAAAALEHPNICTVYEVDEAEGQAFIAMSYIEGQSLKDKLREGPLDVDEAKDIAIQVAEGLKEAHEKGIVHRDIKPANIMLTKKGQAKITDFGLAKLSWGVDLTKASTIMGTVAYMSPEQAKGDKVDHRTDVWSLGAMLYEMLSGERPFQKNREQALIFAILNDKPTPLSLLRSDIPAYIENVVEKALIKNASERYQKIEELISDIKESPPITFPKAEKSIVVLPFDDLSPDHDQEYFSDGLTEEVISDLSGIAALRVISRSSTMSFKGTKKTAPEIAKQLNVQYVLEGSVRKAGNNLRITAQLIDATKDAHLWAEKYRGTLDDVFDIQEKVSRSIVDALKVELTPNEDDELAKRPIDNVQAYEYYLKASEEITKFSEDAINNALQYLQNAVDIIGDNALLYSSIAFAYWNLVNIGVEHEDYLDKAEEFAQKALSVDPESPLAHVILGYVDWFQEKLLESLPRFKRALEINHNELFALVGIASVYQYAGKMSKAIPYTERLMQIDPLSFPANWYRGAQHFYDGKYEQALNGWQKLYELHPENSFSHLMYAMILAYNNGIDKAIYVVDQSVRKYPDTLFAKLELILKYALQGNQKKALQEMTSDFQKTVRRDCGFAHYLSCFLALNNLKKEALDWLEIAVKDGLINYPLLAEKDPFLENIRGEPRFKKLMERVKHEWENFEV